MTPSAVLPRFLFFSSHTSDRRRERYRGCDSKSTEPGIVGAIQTSTTIRAEMFAMASSLELLLLRWLSFEVQIHTPS